MNGIELFERIQQVSTFDELLQSVNGKTKAETQSKRGNVFEKVWDIIIKFGFYSILPNNIYDHYEGNINTCKLKKVADLEIYLRDISVFSKGKGGSSDITLQNKNNGKWVFMSSKFYLDDSKKSIDNYDVEKILAIVKQHSHKYKEYDIYLVVNNKQKVMNIITSSQSTNNYIKENIHHILDLEDLEICFQHLKHSIQDITIGEVNSKFYNTKVPLLPRFHQELITYKQMERINEGEKELLLGAKARSGKTYCVGNLLIKYLKKYNVINGLIITPRTKTEECKYPCVYTVNSKSEITYYYSSKQHGHYEVPKFIWSNGRISSIGSYVDINGDYGLTQFAYAIIDKPENLQKIKEVFDTKDFRNLMELCAVGQLTVNYKVISIFKKDFWKIFTGEIENEVIEIEVKPKVKKLRIVKPKKKLIIVEEEETA
jgi:hypothetical protein